ncbi:MAG: hypothetical protein C4291_13410 [Candidatus Dadabacteria bacterium]
MVDLANYKIDQAERDLKMKLIDFSNRPDMQVQIGEAFYIWMNNPGLSGEDMDEDDIDDLTFTKFLDWFIYDFKLLDTGKRLIHRFYEEESRNLSNIERYILDGWIDNLFSFFEVEEVIPKEGCRIRDIFTGEVFQIKDSKASSQISRSDIIGGRPLRVGSNTHFSGVVSIYPQAFKHIILDLFKRELKEYRKNFGKKRTPKEYLKDWGFLIERYIEDIANNPQFFTPEGDELVFASSTYSVKDYDKILEKLEKIDSLEEIKGGTNELRAFSWIRKRKIGQSKILGNIEIERDRLTIECYSSNLLDKGKILIESKLRGLISHKEDSIKQLESFLDKQPRETSKGRRLPPGVKSQSELDTVLDEYYDRWIDKPLEVLDNKTPREALETNEGREKLGSILKELQSFYEEAKERGEPYYNVENLRKKLRLK